MHDPMVVAFEIRRPWPTRSSIPAKEGMPRFEWKRHGPWWKPGAWSCFMVAFGRQWYWPSLITIWHVEPNGHDSGEICKHYERWPDGCGGWESKVLRGWRWHIWHWHVQIAPVQKLKRYLFERCIECGRRYPWGYAPVSHSWDGPSARWFRVGRVNYHHECSGLVSLRGTRDRDETLIKHLFAAYRLGADLDEAEALARLTDARARTLEFHESYRLQGILGYERDDAYNLVRKAASHG